MNVENLGTDRISADVVPSLVILANTALKKKLESGEEILKKYLKPGIKKKVYHRF